ncbi:MAG: hypothetical protein OEZ35_05490 [Candidatus Bathyarchaeota archaeon]|nr:hypothetical protein [Candidatus Bathyarchaeota archaeon]
MHAGCIKDLRTNVPYPWKHGVDCVVDAGKGRIFRRKDGKYLIYLPLDLATDSIFPFKTETSVRVKVSFKKGEKKLVIEPLEEKS